MDIVVTIVIALIVLFFLVDGVRRGLLRSVFEIVGLVAAFFCAVYFGHDIAARLAGAVDISREALLYFFSFVVFVAVVVVFHLIGVLLQKIASATLLGPIDRLGGAALGAIRGVLVVSLLLVILTWLPMPRSFKERVREHPVAARMYPVLPSMYRTFIDRSGGDGFERPADDAQETRQRDAA